LFLRQSGAETIIQPGHYADKQLFSRSGLVRFSHGSRFRLARELVAPFAGGRLLDYGCGDGTFLDLVQDLFPGALGADVDREQIADCEHRFSGRNGIHFVSTDCLAAQEHLQAYKVVTCMEVLEHCPDDVQREVLDRIASVTATRGTLVISVPIEIGPPLVAKQCARGLLAMRGLREYSTRERYRPAEMARMLLAGPNTTFLRQEVTGTTADGRVFRYTGHKGFNWRALQRVVEQRFAIEKRLFSPLPVFGPLLNSQVWFVCTKG
jgi:2-polyprenyl-3-methyl-5-hydroxy-6-metoxy-1,4-benzoquinol methylase